MNAWQAAPCAAEELQRYCIEQFVFAYVHISLNDGNDFIIIDVSRDFMYQI